MSKGDLNGCTGLRTQLPDAEALMGFLLLLSCPDGMQALDIFAVEMGVAIDVDGIDQSLVHPIVNGLPGHVKLFTYLCDGHELVRSFFLKEAQQRRIE